MSFLLLAKGPDDRLSLLSPQPLGSRREALDALSRKTAEPDFAWDAEVYVVDLDQVTPVLLVRPPVSADDSVAGEAEATPPSREAPEPETATTQPDDAVVVEEPEPVLVEELDIEALEVEAPHIEEPHVEELETQSDALQEAEPVLVEEAPIRVEHVDEAWAEAVAETAVAPVSEPTEPMSLREAITRTAAHMESTGVVAPASIGSALAVADHEMIEEDPVDELAEAIAAVVLNDPESGGSEQSPGTEKASEPAGWPWASLGELETFTIEALEEPGTDEGSLVRASGDDETMSIARPVILGSYDNEAAQGPKQKETDVQEPSQEETAAREPKQTKTAEQQPEPAASAEPAEEPRETSEPKVVEVPSDSRKPATMESDLILDLEEAVGESSEEEPAGYQPSGSEAQDLTCDECVYVETCPNKEQREPASCGSFQWR